MRVEVVLVGERGDAFGGGGVFGVGGGVESPGIRRVVVVELGFDSGADVVIGDVDFEFVGRGGVGVGGDFVEVSVEEVVIEVVGGELGHDVLVDNRFDFPEGFPTE